jgi:hypothetical protein
MMTFHLAQQMLGAIPIFASMLSEFYKAQSGRTFPSSPMEAEKAVYSDPESVDLAYDFVAFLTECAADNMLAFHKTMVEPIPAFGVWVSVRATFETSAYAAWLAEPGISVTERVTRGFAFRYKSLDEAAKFSRARDPRSDASRKGIERVCQIEESARSQGISVLTDKKDKTIGIGMPLPSATCLVTKIFKDEPSYRLLSGLAHGYPWTAGLVLKLSEPDDGVSRRLNVRKEVSAENVGYLSARSVRAFAKAVWYRSQQLGWDLAYLSRILEETFDTMTISEKERFWR